jgi:hypothetical protein
MVLPYNNKLFLGSWHHNVCSKLEGIDAVSSLSM